MKKQFLLPIVNISIMFLMESTDVLSIRNIIIVSTFCYKHVYYVPNGKYRCIIQLVAS